MANGDWRIFLRIEYEYRKNPDDSLQVAGWEISGYKPDNSLQTQTRARITELTLNAPLSDADFRFEFPVGTRISVMKAGQFERSYILLKDGQECPAYIGENRPVKTCAKQIDLPMAVNAVEFSAAGKLLAASVNDGTILVWEMGSLLGK